MPSSAGKRAREQQKREKAQVKAERKAARQAPDSRPEDASPHRSESELVAELGALHRAFEAGEISLPDFEERRDRLQTEFACLS